MEARGTESVNQSDEELSHQFRAAHDPEDIYTYRDEKLESIKQGKPTWMIRNSVSEHGRIYDYFVERKPVAFVDEDDESCSMPYANGEGGPQPLTNKEVSLATSIETVEAYFN